MRRTLAPILLLLFARAAVAALPEVTLGRVLSKQAGGSVTAAMTAELDRRPVFVKSRRGSDRGTRHPEHRVAPALLREREQRERSVRQTRRARAPPGPPRAGRWPYRGVTSATHQLTDAPPLTARRSRVGQSCR